MARKKTFHVHKEARKLGPYDERPMLPDDIDVQLHLSRNDRPQPFFLICEKDTLIAQMAGSGRLDFTGTSIASFRLAPGDYVYVPAGVPHRLVPDGECVTMRYKPREPGLEGVAWYCDACHGEVHREVWDTAERLPQEGYFLACTHFNDDRALRACARCGAEHPAIDLSPYRWAALAEEIRAEAAG